MDERAASLFEDRNLVYIATLMGDGAPQLSPVWASYEDGHIMVNTAEGRVKHKNVLRDPRVAVSAVSHSNPLHMATVRGTVVEVIADYEYRHADKLTKKYLGRDAYPFKRPGEKRTILKIRPDKTFVMPEMRADGA